MDCEGEVGVNQLRARDSFLTSRLPDSSLKFPVENKRLIVGEQHMILYC